MDANLDVRGWLTAERISTLGIRGCPKSAKRVHDYAAREKWEMRLVDSAGRSGSRREYRLPDEIQALINKDVSTGFAAPAALQSQTQSQVNLASRAYGVAEPGPSDVDSEINAHLLWLCHDACLQVHGDAFNRESVQVQIDYAVDLYNLLLRLSAAKRANSRSNPKDFNRLDAEDMGSQLRLFLQMGWVKPFPPNKFDPKRVNF